MVPPFRNFPGFAAAASSLIAVITLAGCGGNLYRPIGPPPADTVTFPAASTQGWLQQLGTGYTAATPSGDTAYGVATDSQGDVIVLDQTRGAFTGFTNPNHLPQFAVIKFDDTGKMLWAQQIGSGSRDYPSAIATDAQGNIFIGGSTRGAFPGFTNSSGNRQSVVIKLNPSGQTQWIQQFSTGNNSSQVTSLAADSSGNVVAGGMYASYYNSYGYITKLSAATGSVLWNQGSGSSNTNQGVSGVAVDNQGNVVAVGSFAASTSPSAALYMVAKLNGSSGQTIWQQAPASFSPYGGQLLTYTQTALDAQGDIFVGGVDQSSGYGRCAVAELANATGTQQWQQKFGAAQQCTPGGIAVDNAGNVLLTGLMQSPFFTSTNPPETDDVFLAKLSSGGSAVWLQQFGTGDDGGGTNSSALVFVATDPQNHADVAGTTQGAFPNFTNANNINQLFVTQFAP